MRVALLASIFAATLAAPAAAQCVYVACAGAQQTQAAPVSSPPATVSVQSRSYEEGYAAGLAARTVTHRTVTRVRHVAARPATKAKAKRHVARPSRHVGAAPARHVTPSRVHAHPTSPAHRRVSHARTVFVDPIKDRATTYRAAAVGSSTVLASHMQQSSRFTSTSSSTSWIGPSQIIQHGGQNCGWGTRIETNQFGQTNRQSAWLCQCPQGWRPPGY
jgi:hypothetical protein